MELPEFVERHDTLFVPFGRYKFGDSAAIP